VTRLLGFRYACRCQGRLVISYNWTWESNFELQVT
jgi:hypothetical protein